MKRMMILLLAGGLVASAAATSFATPPRGLVHRFGGGYGDCGCEARGPVYHEPSCGCGEPACCDPCCTPCCLRIIPNLVRRTGCLLDKLFTCHRCYDPCCDMGCEVGCDAGCTDMWHAPEYQGIPVPEAEGTPMSRTTRSYQHWNMTRRPSGVTHSSARPSMAPRSAHRKPEASVVRSKPATKKPAKLPTHTASDARSSSAEQQADLEQHEEETVSAVRRTSFDEPVKSSTKRIPHNPLRD